MTLYTLAKGSFSILFSLMGWKITGAENLPKEGPVLLAVNHISLWDPIVAACSVNRQVSFMAKEELFSFPLFGWVIKKIGAFPVKRGQGDMAAIRQSLNILKEGKVLGLFPEGTRSKSGEIQKGMPGIVLLMDKAKAPIVPVRIHGTQKLLTRGWGKIRVTVGQPIYPESLVPPENVENRREWIAEKIMEKVNIL